MLERIVDERVGQSVVGSVSVAVDPIAEETFRRTIRELVRRRSPELLNQLLQDGKPSKKRPGRMRRSPAR